MDPLISAASVIAAALAIGLAANGSAVVQGTNPTMGIIENTGSQNIQLVVR